MTDTDLITIEQRQRAHDACRTYLLMSECGPPPSRDIAAARYIVGHTQEAAARTVYATVRAWRAWEAGERPMHPALWQLYLLKYVSVMTHGRADFERLLAMVEAL